MINKYKTKVVKFHHVETPLYLRISDKNTIWITK